MARCWIDIEHRDEVHGGYFVGSSSYFLFLTIFQVQSLDDVKSNSQNDSNAAKQMALDHLGVIAAKVRSSRLKFQKESNKKPLKPLDDVSPPAKSQSLILTVVLRLSRMSI